VLGVQFRCCIQKDETLKWHRSASPDTALTSFRRSKHCGLRFAWMLGGAGLLGGYRRFVKTGPTTWPWKLRHVLPRNVCTSYQPTPRNVLEEARPQLYRGRSLTSREQTALILFRTKHCIGTIRKDSAVHCPRSEGVNTAWLGWVVCTCSYSGSHAFDSRSQRQLSCRSFHAFIQSLQLTAWIIPWLRQSLVLSACFAVRASESSLHSKLYNKPGKNVLK
jgi:hypothetical protein